MRTSVYAVSLVICLACVSMALKPGHAIAGEAAGDRPDSISRRIRTHGFPSIFEAWNGAENLRNDPAVSAIPLSSIETIAATTARHDLYWAGPGLGLRLAGNQQYEILSPEFTPESIAVARQNRDALLDLNPHMLILAELHYYSAPVNFLPPDSPWWLPGSAVDNGGRLLDFANPAFQDKAAALCGALVETGVYDGCMLDWWSDETQVADRVSLIRKVRDAVGEKAILMGNVNGQIPTHTARWLNGMYMEGFGSVFFSDWRHAAQNLRWGQANLRWPAITALEGWWSTGRGQYPLMREITTLALVFSNGYILFSDPNSLPTPDHLHDWYRFWTKSLGRPVGPLADPDRPSPDGAYTRRFEHGDVIFNPPSNHTVTVRFQRPRYSAATATTEQSFTVAAGDGDLYITTEPDER
jgi:hypothetical protein